jgi:cell division control protein 24
MQMRFAHIANSTNPAPSSRQNPYGSDRTFSVLSQTNSSISSASSALPPYPGPYGSRNSRFASSVGSEDQSVLSGPPGYPPSYDGFDPDGDDDYEDYPMMSSTPGSGRGTPMGVRRPGQPDGYSSVRSSASAMSPLPINSHPYAMASGRPSTSRTSQQSQRPALRSQFSSAGLKDLAVESRSASRASGPSPQPPMNTMPTTRSRSASQPSAYVPRQPPPPLPTNGPWEERSQHPLDNKRGSGSSQSTGDNSSDYSPNSGSPITPYGSSDSSLSGMTTVHGRPHHDKVLASATQQLQFSVPVKVKVHFHEDIFVIQVPRATEYEELVERVGRKIRLCGPRRDDGPLRVKYKDEDGDLVSLGSTEDVQMAFESFRPGSQVTLYVQ